MNPDTLARIAAAAGDSGLDAIVAMSPENFAYLTGPPLPARGRARSRHLMLVVRPNGETALFAHEADAPALARRFADVALATWSERDQSAIDSLADMLWDMSLSSARIGIETDYLSARDLLALGAALPKAEFGAGEGVFATARLTKTPRELARIGRAARIAEAAVAAALPAVRPGVSRREVAAELARAVYGKGGEGIAVLEIASGPPGAAGDPVPGSRALARGELCRIELATHVEGYHAVIRRTVPVAPAGGADARGKAAREAAASLVAMIRPGVGARELQRAYLKRAAPLEAPPKEPVGRGIGLGLDEPPLIGGAGDGELREGMVLVLEPLVHDRELGFELWSKDMALVTASGAELLTGAPGENL